MYEKGRELTNEKIKDDWILTLNSFMNQIIQWVSESRPDQTLPYELQSIEQAEEYLGWYSVPSLTFTAGAKRVEIRAMGRLAFGAIGRVDMTDGKLSFTFLYSGSKGWIFLGNRKPLTKPVFLELFHQVV